MLSTQSIDHSLNNTCASLPPVISGEHWENAVLYYTHTNLSLIVLNCWRGHLLMCLPMLCWLSYVYNGVCVYAIVCAYQCNWVMSCIHTEGAGSSHRLSSEGRTSTAAFSTQGSTGPSAGTQCCTYLYSAVKIFVHPLISYRFLKNSVIWTF